MPIRIPDNLPAVELLKKENIFIIGDSRAEAQEIRQLKIGLVNLMPLKIQTETDFLRLLSNSPLQIEVDLIDMSSHSSRNTSQSHLQKFYKQFKDIKNRNYDGLIITGAPVEHLEFEDVDFWEELTAIMDWAKNHVTSTMFICWAALAGLYNNYGIQKQNYSQKLSGVYKHILNSPFNPLLRGFDDTFYAPHSRFAGISIDALKKNDELEILTSGASVGPHIIMGRNGREFYITGHSEYSPEALKQEYERDLERGLNPSPPVNYFLNDDVERREPVVKWRSHANLLFSNWLNYFVYQVTPYNIQTPQLHL